MKSKSKGVIKIGMSVFCLQCQAQIRTANCEDMNEDDDTCPQCGPTTIGVGLAIRANTPEALDYAYEQMHKHHALVKELLSERNRK